MKKIALYLLMSIGLLGCGSDDSKPGVAPGLGATPPKPPANQTPPPSSNEPPANQTPPPNSNEPPTDSTFPPPNPNDTPTRINVELLSGVYTGVSTDVTGKKQTIEGLVDDNKSLWFVYSEAGDVLGFTNSNDNVKASNGEFSVKGKDYFLAPNVLDITIVSDYKTLKVIEGKTFDLPSNPTTYNVKYDETLSAKKQSLDMIDNQTFIGSSYVTGDTDAVITKIKFTKNGAFTADGEGCTMTGKLKLSESKRYFVNTMTFGNEPCADARKTHTGVALLNKDNELVFLGTNEEKGIFFSGEVLRR